MFREILSNRYKHCETETNPQKHMVTKSQRNTLLKFAVVLLLAILAIGIKNYRKNRVHFANASAEAESIKQESPVK